MPEEEGPRIPEDRFVVSMHYIRRIQQQSFWNRFWRSVEIHPEIDHDIKIPRGVGYRAVYSESEGKDTVLGEILYWKYISRAITPYCE